VAGATFHEAKRTLNLTPGRIFGRDLVRWVEERLLEVVSP
jgi:hypothetical protein